MNVLEKILEEIEEKFKTADADKFDCEELCDVEDWYDSGYIDGQLSAHEKCMDIIRSHIDDGKGKNVLSNDDMEEKIREHIAECLHRIDNIRSFTGSKEYTNNDEKCIRNIEVLKTIITALEGYLSSKKKSGNDGWISVEERLPNREECQKNNREFFVQDENGNRFSCEYDSESNGYDNPKWCCNTMIVAWQNFPEPYKPDEN